MALTLRNDIERYRRNARRGTWAAGLAAAGNALSRLRPTDRRRMVQSATQYANQAASRIQQRWRNRSFAREIRSRVLSRRASYGGAPKYLRRRRFRGNRSSSKLEKNNNRHLRLNFLRMITTPVLYRNTRAWSIEGNGVGRRNIVGRLLLGRTDVNLLQTYRPAGILYPSASLGNNKDMFMIDRCKFLFTMQNRSNWDMHLVVYECLARMDIQGAEIDFTNLTNIRTVLETDDVIQRNKHSLQDAWSGGTKAAAFDQAPTFTPYMSSSFCCKFKILKAHKYKLGPNEYVIQKFVMGPKKITPIIYDDSVSSRARPEGIGRYSKYLLFSYIGGPMDNNNGASSMQSRSTNDLFVTEDTFISCKWFPNCLPLHVMGTGDAGEGNISSFTTQNYSTDSAVPTPPYVIPATETIQTVSGNATVGDVVPPSHA